MNTICLKVFSIMFATVSMSLGVAAQSEGPSKVRLRMLCEPVFTPEAFPPGFPYAVTWMMKSRDLRNQIVLSGENNPEGEVMVTLPEIKKPTEFELEILGGNQNDYRAQPEFFEALPNETITVDVNIISSKPNCGELE